MLREYCAGSSTEEFYPSVCIPDDATGFEIWTVKHTIGLKAMSLNWDEVQRKEKTSLDVV